MNDAIERLRQKIKSECRAGEISTADRDALLTFSKELALRRSEYSDHRHTKLLSHGRQLAQADAPGVTKALADKGAAKDLVAWVHREYENEETNRDYRVALRRIGALLAETEHVPGDVELSEKGLPRPVSWVSASTSTNYDPAPDPGQMLKWDDDVKPMIELAENERDAALIALQFDAGLRGGELYDLTVGSISDHKHGLQVTVQGKMGQRTVTLIPSVPYIKRWLSAHPGSDDPDAALWSHLSRNQQVSRSLLNRIFKRAADHAGVTKPVTPTNFRKSSASWAASRGMNQAHIEDRYGWVRGSRTASRYVSIFKEDSDREYAKMHGIDVKEEEPEDRSPIECPNCGNENPPDRDMCVWCGQALEPGTARVVDELESKMLDAMAKTDDAEVRQQIRDQLDRLSENPELMSEWVAQYVEE